MTRLQTLIKGCSIDDARCQKLLYEQFYGYAFKIAFRYIDRYDGVADVVNDAFVKLFRNISSFTYTSESDTEPCLMGWIRKIVVNTAIDKLRKYKPIFHKDDFKGIWIEPRASQTADAPILYKELIGHLKSLPPSYSTVFNMFVIDGFSHQEIAEQLHISVGTSKSNLYKAKASLQKLIKEEVVYSDI